MRRCFAAGDADAGVGHHDVQAETVLLLFGYADAHQHLPAVGELDGVSGQV